MDSSEKLVLLSRCRTVIEAEMIRGILNGADIESFATNQLGSVILRDQLLTSDNSVDIYVKAKEADLALALLNADIVEEE